MEVVVHVSTSSGRLRRALAVVGALILTFVALPVSNAGAATPQPSPRDAQPAVSLPDPATTSAPATPVGYDVSWPQCATWLPSGQAFAIVGVNGGLANTTNPCLATQLAWAAGSSGTTDQPAVALYVNTANPPAAVASWWPTSNVYPTSARDPVANPYGQCAGQDGPACSYIYGYAKAYNNGNLRGLRDPAQYFWWLDVETENTWSPNRWANRAVLEGMTHYYLDVLGAPGVGIYSTGYQWARIVGALGPVESGTTAPGPSNLNGLPSWLAGATSLAAAQANCADVPLTGGRVTLTQYLVNGLDHNYACP